MPVALNISSRVLAWAAIIAGAGACERRSDQMDLSIFQYSEDDLKSASGKITYLGPQEKPIPTTLFATLGYEAPIERFAQFQSRRKAYQNDDPSNIRRFEVTPREFHRILDAIRGIVKSSAGQRPDFLSFAVIIQDDGAEFQVNRGDARAFFRAIRNALDGENELGRNLLSRQERNVLPGQ